MFAQSHASRAGKSLVLAAVLLAASVAAAAPVSYSDAELDAYATLRDARARADVLGVSRGAGARETGEALFVEALDQAGWTFDRYTQMDAVMDEVLGILRDAPAEGPGAATARQAALEQVDAPTLGRIQKRRVALEGAAARAAAGAQPAPPAKPK